MYGLNIIIRVFEADYELNLLGIVSTLLIYAGYSFMFVGLGDIIDQTRNMTLIVMLLPVIPIGGFFTGLEWPNLSAFLILFLSLLIGGTLIYIHIKSDTKLHILIFGWFMILFLNIIFVSGFLDPGIVDLLQGIQKIVLYLGIRQPRFTSIADRFEQYMISGFSSEFVDLSSGSLSMIDMRNLSRDQEEDWIIKRAAVNKAKGVRTILLSMYDLINTSLLADSDPENDIYYVKVLQGVTKNSPVFEDQTMVLRDDMRLISLFFRDLVDYSIEKRIPCEVILYNLSTLIHSHNWRPVYGFLISATPIIKTSSVNLICIYHPESHEDDSEIKKFETLADSVIHL